MSFHDVRFPDDIAYGATGGPGYNTDVITVKSGKERRNANWVMGRCSWDVSTGLKNQADLDKLIAFFRARLGKAYAFRFKDWTDYRMPRQQIATGDGVATTVQLAKAYTDAGGYQVSRDITKPVAGTVQIWLGGVPQGGGWACDPLTGIVTFAAAPAAGVAIEAACESAIDTALFTEPTEGSKTSEFYITVSTYGAAIPILYGGRISGNIIWAGDVIEEKDEQTSDVFFGLFEVTTAIDYKYYATFAVSLGEGVVTSVDQIWADGTLVYDPSTSVFSIDFTLYSGSETQGVDPDIEAKEGSGNAPAYRGQAYVVVKRLYLGDWGNRIPNLTFAVTTTTKYGGA